MTARKSILPETLRGAERLAVLGVGSPLRGDDAAGMLAADGVRRLGRAEIAAGRLAVFLGETAPENLTGPIKTFRPTHLVAIDAADLGLPPGGCRVIEPVGIAAAGTPSTHSLPLRILTDYIAREIGCRVVIIAIQASETGFGRPPCPAVRAAARSVARQICRCLAV